MAMITMSVGPPQPCRVIFFPKGFAVVFDEHGVQMPQFQRGDHQDTIAALTNAGYRLHNLWVFGRPVFGVPS
jgi:excinuclease UvrABC helicase subunit UvrB